MKRRDVTVPPYLSWGLIVRNCAATLERCLTSVRQRTPNAEIVVVDTCSRDDSGVDVAFARSSWREIDDSALRGLLETEDLDLVHLDVPPKCLLPDAPVTVRVRARHGVKIPAAIHGAAMMRAAKAVNLTALSVNYGHSTREIAERYADIFEVYHGPKGDWSDSMDWFDDAAAARNRTMELSHGEVFGWIDSDDILPDGKTCEALLKKNGRWQPAGPEKPVIEVQSKDAEQLPTLEEIIRESYTRFPDTDALWAPYMYRPGDAGEGLEWQDRERFVRNWKKWEWKESSHEVLVAKNPKDQRPSVYLAHFLFVHGRRFNLETQVYALNRHFDVLLKRYDAGIKTTRVCTYLENYSRFKCPSRREEFIRAAYDGATTGNERYRACIMAGNYAIENGLFYDGMESYVAATYHRPDLPDAWFAGAKALGDLAEDWIKATIWYRNGLACRPGLVDSEITPRDFLIRRKFDAAMASREAGRFARQSGVSGAEIARSFFHDAAEIAGQVARTDLYLPSGDRQEACAIESLAKNERDGIGHLLALHRLWAYLIANDETKKAMLVLAVVPHNYLDHPLVVEMERWRKKLTRHLSDPVAYADFYADDEATGWVPSDAISSDATEATWGRAKFVADWLEKNAPRGRILEIGCSDGTTAIPVLKRCPNITYFGVDVAQRGLDGFRERAVKHLSDGMARVKLQRGMDTLDGAEHLGAYDAVMFLEVLEHVPDPSASIQTLMRYLCPGGRLFITTPWGAYDKGFPRNMATRDPRGHVRAMMPRDVKEAVETAGGKIETLHGNIGIVSTGAHIEVTAKKRAVTVHTPARVAFAVPSALWDWNASTVLANGMGASEETIVYLARHLARLGDEVDVFGPIPHPLLPDEEIHDGVGYWPREHLRKLDPGATVIVSRAPVMGRQIEEAMGGKLDKILWLQDTHYDDLDEDTAADYRAIVCVSKWHQELIQTSIPKHADRVKVIPNFLLAEHFQGTPPSRSRTKFVYASSPDRGLLTLLRMWPEIRARWPDAALDVFYGWRGCIKLTATGAPGWRETFRKMRAEYNQLRWQDGVVETGMVNHLAIAAKMRGAAVWPYPTAFHETACVNALKARAAGSVPVTTPLAGLNETAVTPWTQFVDSDADMKVYAPKFLDAMARAMEVSDADRARMSEAAIEEYRIESVFPKWRALLSGRM